MPQLQVHLADSDHFSRSGIKGILSDAAEIDVEVMYDSVEETINGLKTASPDILLVSDTLHTDQLLEDLARINEANSDTPTIFLANNLRSQQIAQIYNAGCRGYVSKRSILNSDFVSALNLVATGYTLFANPSEGGAFPPRSTLMHEMTTLIREIDIRDQQIIIAVASGMRNSEIATSLHVSQGTVKQRLGWLMEIFGVTNRVQLAVVAAEAGLVASVKA